MWTKTAVLERVLESDVLLFLNIILLFTILLSLQQTERVDFSTYKNYVFSHLKDHNTPLCKIEEEIEALCWEIAKPFYKLETHSCTEERTKQVGHLLAKNNHTF